MERVCRYLSVLLALLTLRVAADCASYGVDYSNGGTYSIDVSSNQYFSFITVFQGCSQESINPVLVAPDGNEYACSPIQTQPAGQQVTSNCGIPYSSMFSGTWKIIVAGKQISTQRVINLRVGVPQTTYVTVTPTVIVGYTTTARATTVQSIISQTQTLILVPSTVTAVCNGVTRTVTVYPQGPTVTVGSTVVRTVTDGQRTSFYTTTATATASCHYPNKKRDVAATAAVAAVAAVTSTLTASTTVTSTIYTTIPARTVTEQVLRTVTATITPAPSTVCGGGGGPGATVTVIRGTATTTTQTDMVYSTSYLTGTVWVGQTQYTTITNSASATACWRAGGWFGF